MYLPEWALPFKEKGTEIKKINDGFYKYEEYSKEKFNEKLHSFGTMTITYNIADQPDKITFNQLFASISKKPKQIDILHYYNLFIEYCKFYLKYTEGKDYVVKNERNMKNIFAWFFDSEKTQLTKKHLYICGDYADRNISLIKCCRLPEKINFTFGKN